MEYRYAFGCKRLKGFVRNAVSPSCKKQTTVGHFARTSLLLLFMLCSMMASAQQVEVTLTEAGTLSEKIASDQKYTITSLKVSGPINGTDVKYLREMAGQGADGNSTDGKLVDLDLIDAKIVEGGDCYYADFYSTKNYEFGIYMFYGCKLESIKLPNSVTSIGNYAFSECSAIVKLITLCATHPECGFSVFDGINKQRCTLYVPKNSLEDYQKADQWKDFNNMEEIDPTGISLPNGSNKVIKRYDANGRMTDKPTKGLNILKMSDGTTRKVMVK